MTPEQRRQLCKDIDASHERHRVVVERIAAGLTDGLDKEWDELDRLNEDILRRTKEYMGRPGERAADSAEGTPQFDERRREEQGNRGPGDVPGFGQGG
jgi:hypothetical protein